MTAERQDIHNSDIPIVCQSCEARHKGVCGALTPDQLTTLAKQTRKHALAAGSVLINEAEHLESHSNIIKGVVKLSKMLADGRQQIVSLQFAPDFLGRPLADESSMTAEAASEVSLCSFPKSVLDRLINDSPDLEHRLLQQALKELDEARDWMVTLGRKSAKEKIASFLYLIATHIDPESEEEAVSFSLPLNRADIADFLGLTTETVSRQMTRLRQDGIIQIARHREITITDLDQLMEEAGY